MDDKCNKLSESYQALEEFDCKECANKRYVVDRYGNISTCAECSFKEFNEEYDENEGFFN